MLLNLLLSIIGFMVGFSVGALWKGRVDANWLKSYVVIVVTAVWASSFIVEIYSPNYHPPVGLYPLMTTVIGLLVADRLRGGYS